LGNRLPARDELLRAHKMSISDDSRPLSATLYGRGAERIIELEGMLEAAGIDSTPVPHPEAQ